MSKASMAGKVAGASAPAPGLAAPRQRAAAWSPAKGGLLLLALPLAMLALFFLLPLLVVLGQSFTAPAGPFDSYVRLAGDSALRNALTYTFQTAAIVTLAALVLSYPVAFLISRAQGRWLVIGMVFVLVPFWTSAVIRSYAWLVLLQRRGVLNEMMLALGLIDRPLRLTNTDIGTHVAMVQIMLPFMILPLLSAMRGIDASVLRAAAILGANPWRQFLHVYLPLSMPGVGAGCVLVFISTLGFYITPALLGGSSQMIAVAIEQQVSRLLDWPLASALATLLLVLTCLLFMLYERLNRRLAGAGEAR
ncbi:ABC transporter permease [Ancylobacter sp. 6x-1]|uniref:ABC transporter permease n=1 Tax=Ancylobacter crimeensis TaxID=2579147 RepID=A0ABT0DDW2_9HYPH|nr:ABC transporter permease [Ancylobacter crimeensis]MCK0198140.1 ABC transporter permease [Ancylobacter crimeensis]